MSLGIIDLQRRFRELGRLRMGSKGAKGQPQRLSDWRLTSPSIELLTVAAEVYGGEVKVWEGAPTEGRQYELFTGTDRLDVLVPPNGTLSQAWELWSGGGCVRRCNGAAQEGGEACACPSEVSERIELSKKGKACKPTTRFSLVLPRIPDIGVWRVESHGVNAAVELPGTVEILRRATEVGELIPAQLRIDNRTSKVDGKTQHYVVPVLELPTVTTAALLAGEAPSLSMGAREIAAPAPRAIGSGGGATASSNPTKKGQAAIPPPEQPPLPGEEPVDTGRYDTIHKHLDRLGPRTLAVVKEVWKSKGWGSIAANATTPITDDDLAAAEALADAEYQRVKVRSQRVVLAAKGAGLESDDERHALVRYVTAGATDSSKDVTDGEVEAIVEAATSFEQGFLELVYNADGSCELLPPDEVAS